MKHVGRYEVVQVMKLQKNVEYCAEVKNKAEDDLDLNQRIAKVIFLNHVFENDTY